MTDREMLELAAKGAGYQVTWNDNWNCFQHRNPVPDKFGSCRHPWVPLEDDGDALRLAVVLGMEVYIDNHSEGCACTEAQSHSKADNARVVYNHTYEQDQFEATRRAIVRAAAEIGKAMP